MKLPQTLIIESSNKELRNKTALEAIKLQLCLKPKSDKPCDTCKSCRTFESGNHPDFIRIIKPEDRKNISVDQIREEFISKINSQPMSSQVICVLVEDSQLLSTGAQNSMLKTLEEPPEYVRIILTVDQKTNLLPTILSRSHIKQLAKDQLEYVKDHTLLNEIVEKDLTERFAIAKEIVDRERKEEIKDFKYCFEFLDKLTLELRSYLRDKNLSIKELKIIGDDLDAILEYKAKISYNTNRQLALENLLMNHLDNEFYKRLGIN